MTLKEVDLVRNLGVFVFWARVSRIKWIIIPINV